MKLGTALAVAALSLGFAGSASATPTTPCTAENQGATEYIPNPPPGTGGVLYLCFAGNWELVAHCQSPGRCTWV